MKKKLYNHFNQFKDNMKSNSRIVNTKLAWTFAARVGDKYQIRLTRSILCCIYAALMVHLWFWS